MAKTTKIQWTDHTFNPWWGCTKVSPACDNCYAESMAKRWKRADWGPGVPRTRLSQAHWRAPLKWNLEAKNLGVRRRVFCASMADVFEGGKHEDELRSRLWNLIEITPHLDWLLLTKRPANIKKLVPKAWLAAWPRNAWAGATIETEEWAQKRLEHLLALPAPVRFVSVEPMLSEVDLTHCLGTGAGKVNWVICGGESGPQARGCDETLEWYRNLRDQCLRTNVPFFFKQWGNFAADGDHLIKLGAPKASSKLAFLDGVLWQQWPSSTNECFVVEGGRLTRYAAPVRMVQPLHPRASVFETRGQAQEFLARTEMVQAVLAS